jgi:hypothetical protein
MRLFALALLFVCGCEPTEPPPKPPDDRVYPVSPAALTRDRQTADAYDGCRVELRLGKYDYVLVRDELHVPAAVPNTLPCVVCRPVRIRDTPAVTVTGRVRVVRDGVRRGLRCDFYVSLAVESVTTR